jgi:hypothetical protein
MKSSRFVDEILPSCGLDLAELWMRFSRVVDEILPRVDYTCLLWMRFSPVVSAFDCQFQHPPRLWISGASYKVGLNLLL